MLYHPARMTTKAPTDWLRSVDLFGELSESELEDVARRAKEVRFDPGRQIVTEGEAGVGFHIIVEGEATVAAGGRDVGKLQAGDYFGEISLVDRGPRSATVTATSPVRTLSIISWDFLPLIERNPSLATKLLVRLCRRLRAAERSLTH